MPAFRDLIKVTWTSHLTFFMYNFFIFRRSVGNRGSSSVWLTAEFILQADGISETEFLSRLLAVSVSDESCFWMFARVTMRSSIEFLRLLSKLLLLLWRQAIVLLENSLSKVGVKSSLLELKIAKILSRMVTKIWISLRSKQAIGVLDSDTLKQIFYIALIRMS